MAERGYEAVVKVLLATEKVEANPKDNYGWISLSWERRTGTRRGEGEGSARR